MRKLLSSSEIVTLQLPGLPTTKVGVAAMAKRDGWYSEERKGLGGTRKVYEVPDRYLPASAAGTSTAMPHIAKVIGTIAAGSAQVDPQKLELAIRALGEWEVERGLKVSDERRPAVIAVLYDYLQKAEGEGAEAMALVLRALG